jgi:hypothetical protein
MRKDRLRAIVLSGKSAYALKEPDYSKVNFAIYCMSLEDKERGLARFWPVIKLNRGEK